MGCCQGGLSVVGEVDEGVFHVQGLADVEEDEVLVIGFGDAGEELAK